MHVIDPRVPGMNEMSKNVYSVKENIGAGQARVQREIGTVPFLYDDSGNRKYLTDSERAAFLDAASRQIPPIRTFCRLPAISGARISEALALTPRHFDYSAGIVIVECLKKRRRGVAQSRSR
jgi:integrase